MIDRLKDAVDVYRMWMSFSHAEHGNLTLMNYQQAVGQVSMCCYITRGLVHPHTLLLHRKSLHMI